jgi:type IV pilus assembly protein PilA
LLTAIRSRLNRKEEGFTLIELMVVVLIIAILIAIAIPTFLGARKRAQDRAVQSNIRNAFTAEKTHYTDAQVYTETVADLAAIEPSLTFVQGNDPSAGTGNTIYVNGTTTVFLSAKSASGTCYYLKDDAATATQYTKSATCATTAAVGGWSSTPW